MPADELLAQPSDVLGAWPAFGALSTSEQTNLLNAASQVILNYCGRPFAQAMHNEYHSGSNSGRIWLNHRPVISVAAITIDGVAVDNTDGFAWTFNPGTGELVRGRGIGSDRFSGRFSSGLQNILVTYWAGYVSVPDPIVRATIYACRWISDQTRISNIYSSESIGDYSYTLNPLFFNTMLPSHITSLCANYVQDDGLF
jgi:hypothetical protein